MNLEDDEGLIGGLLEGDIDFDFSFDDIDDFEEKKMQNMINMPLNIRQPPNALEQFFIDQNNFNMKIEGLVRALEAKIRIQDDVIRKLRKDLDEKKYGLFD